ncbi:MAG TPA: hypothetical protein VNO55_06525, partial [Polyangia bacterium]|nr:hypothetical protein [Polyangia bacterium]
MAVEPDLLSSGMPDAPPPPEADRSLLGDVAKAGMSSVVDLTAQGAGLIGDVSGAAPDSDIRGIQGLLNEVSTVIDNSISPVNKRAEGAQFIPNKEKGEASITETPVRSALMKGARMTPMLLSSLLLPSGWAGVAAGAGFFGTQGVAQQLNDSRKRIATMTDDELQEKSSLYRGLREDNDEIRAREKLLSAQNDVTTLLTAGVSSGAAGGALGHALKAQTAKGALRGAGVGATDALIGGAVQGVGMDVARQRGETTAGLQNEVDPEEAAIAALNAGLTFAPVGGVMGAYAGAKMSRATRAERNKKNGTTVDVNGPDPAQTAALEEHNQPNETGRPPEPPAGPPPAPPPVTPPGVGGGEPTLAQRIAAERQRQADAAKAAPPEPPAAAPPPVAPADAAMGNVAVPLTMPVEPRVVSPQQAPPADMMVPMPPTDRAAYPPQRNPRIERQAVPLADPDAVVTEPPIPMPPKPPTSVTPKGKAAPVEVKAAPDPLAELNAAIKPVPKKMEEGEHAGTPRNDIGDTPKVSAAREHFGNYEKEVFA